MATLTTQQYSVRSKLTGHRRLYVPGSNPFYPRFIRRLIFHFTPPSVMSVINGQLPQFSFFFIFHLSRVFVVTCGTYLVAPLLSRRRSGDPLNLCFKKKKNYFFETNLPLRVGSSVVYVLTGTVGLC